MSLVNRWTVSVLKVPTVKVSVDGDAVVSEIASLDPVPSVLLVDESQEFTVRTNFDGAIKLVLNSADGGEGRLGMLGRCPGQPDTFGYLRCRRINQRLPPQHLGRLYLHEPCAH